MSLTVQSNGAPFKHGGELDARRLKPHFPSRHTRQMFATVVRSRNEANSRGLLGLFLLVHCAEQGTPIPAAAEPAHPPTARPAVTKTPSASGRSIPITDRAVESGTVSTSSCRPSNWGTLTAIAR